MSNPNELNMIDVLEIVKVVLDDGNLMEWVGEQTDMGNEHLDGIRKSITAYLTSGNAHRLDFSGVEFGSLFEYAYCTGAHIAPVRIDGKWRWVITEIEGGNVFIDGNAVIANHESDTEAGLVQEDEE